jgi:fumarate reductase subunit C
MNKRVITLSLITLFTFLSISSSHALDIPLLTWERGKAQNIVVGGGQNISDFKVQLISERTPAVEFSSSKTNKNGFRVYTTQLSDSLPLGNYSVYVVSNSSKEGSLIAQVRVVGIENFNILQSPKNTGVLGVLITFILVFLSTLRSRKYTFLQFFRHKKLVEDGSILYEKSIPRFAYRTYLLRVGALNSFRPSLFKFLMEFDDALLHKFSPLVWTFLPVFGLLAGIHGGIVTGGHLPIIPFYSLLLLSLISILDAYSGIYVLSGFAIGQIIMGQVMNLRSVIAISALGLAWISTSLFSTYMYLVAQKDIDSVGVKKFRKLRSFVLITTTSIFAIIFFVFAILLLESTSAGSNLPTTTLINTVIFLGIITAAKMYVHENLDQRLFRKGRSNSLEEHMHHVTHVISKPWAITIIVASFLTSFIWTEDWKLALLIGILTLIFFASLFINIEISPLNFLKKIRRSILLESLILALVVALSYLYIQTLPLQSSDRSFIYLVLAFFIPILHRFLSNFNEVPISKEEPLQ